MKSITLCLIYRRNGNNLRVVGFEMSIYVCVRGILKLQMKKYCRVVDEEFYRKTG